VSQSNISLKSKPTKVEVSISQTSFLAGVLNIHLVPNGKRRSFRSIENSQFVRNDFNRTACQIIGSYLTPNNGTFHSNDVLPRKLLSRSMRPGITFPIEHDLRNSSAIAHIDEDEFAKVSPTMDPAHENYVFTDVRFAELAAIICALQISESFEQLCRPFGLASQIVKGPFSAE
jgi:hypothetical protein